MRLSGWRCYVRVERAVIAGLAKSVAVLVKARPRKQAGGSNTTGEWGETWSPGCAEDCATPGAQMARKREGPGRGIGRPQVPGCDPRCTKNGGAEARNHEDCRMRKSEGQGTRRWDYQEVGKWLGQMKWLSAERRGPVEEHRLKKFAPKRRCGQSRGRVDGAHAPSEGRR